ncbi:MAG: hypothetical protein IJ523_08240 [Succinivibrionaceae bacterium]|nr:hypothetical protein [Succinivibrionaceae bacterium]
MSSIKYLAVLAGFVGLSVVGTTLFSAYAHDKYVENAISRISASSAGDLEVREVSADNGFLARMKTYEFRYRRGALAFTLMVQTNFYPFYEKNEFLISNISGDLIKCPYCDYKDLSIEGGWDANYLSNSYSGMYRQGGSNSSFSSKSGEGAISVSGISGDFRGAFGDRLTHFGVKVDQIMTDDARTGFNTVVKRLVGDVDISARPGVFLLNTQNFMVNVYESKNVSTGEKISLERGSISIESSQSGGLADLKATIDLKSYQHNNPKWDNDFQISNGTMDLMVTNADQTFWIDLASIFHNLFHMDGGFRYDVFDRMRKNGTAVDIQRMMLVSKESRGLLKIDKGSQIRFAPGKKNSKEALDMVVQFKVNDGFINDFPDGKTLKQKFNNNDWLVHRSTDSKDEYSTQLVIRQGHCAIGENELEGC